VAITRRTATAATIISDVWPDSSPRRLRPHTVLIALSLLDVLVLRRTPVGSAHCADRPERRWFEATIK
jgi:hypothetical protein